MSQLLLYERLGGAYTMAAAAADHLVDRLHTNATLKKVTPKVADFHAPSYKAGHKFMVTAWSIEAAGAAMGYPGRGMFEARKNLGPVAVAATLQP